MLVGVPVLVEAVMGVGVAAFAVLVGVRGGGRGGAGEAVDELDGVCGHRDGGVCERRATRAGRS